MEKDQKRKGKVPNDQKTIQKGGYKPPLPSNKDKIFTTSDKKSY